VLMALRDLRGPDLTLCDNGADAKLSKHLHCVSTNGTSTFSAFLEAQGAKKEHPLYAAERARLRDRASRTNRTNNNRGRRPTNRTANTKATKVDDGDEGDFLDERVLGRHRRRRQRR